MLAAEFCRKKYISAAREPSSLQSFVTQSGMQMLRSLPLALCASRIRFIR